MATRSEKLLGKVRMFVGQNNGNIPDLLIYEYMTDVSRELAEDGLLIEANDTISVVSGTSSYTIPDGFYRGNVIRLPSGQTLQLCEVDRRTIDFLDRAVLTTTEQSPLYYTNWNGEFIFFDSPNVTGTYNIEFWKTPTTTVSDSQEPETPVWADKAIEYGTLAAVLMMLPPRQKEATYFRALYEKEKQRVIVSKRRTRTVPLTIEAHE